MHSGPITLLEPLVVLIGRHGYVHKMSQTRRVCEVIADLGRRIGWVRNGEQG